MPTQRYNLRQSLVQIVGQLAVLVAVWFGFTAMAQAQEYPGRKPVTIIVPYSAGATDTTLRLIVPHLENTLGQKIVVDNRPGASGSVGYGVGARAAPDGYTLVFVTQSIASNPALFGNAPYDPLTSFQPITLVANLYQMLVANTEAPFNNLSELIALAKQKPGELTYAETGGTARFAMEILADMTGTRMKNITFKGGGESLSAVMGGHVHMLWDSISQMGEHLKAGKLKPIAWAGPRRSKEFPDVPTAAETVPGYEYGGWWAFVAPAGTPAPVIEKLRIAITKALENPELRARMEAGGNEVQTSTPEALTELIKTEATRYNKLVSQMGIQR